MNRICDLVLNECIPCADGNPFANLSAEDPDTNIFLSMQFGRYLNPPPNLWQTDTCVGFCESQVSQNDADDCARRANIQCVTTTWGPPGSPPPLFGNMPTSCNDGEMVCELPAAIVLAISQGEADAIAQSLCRYRLSQDECDTPVGSVGGGDPVPPSDCPMETGVATPSGFDMDDEIVWLNSGILNSPDPWEIESGVSRLQTFDLPPGRYFVNSTAGAVHHVRIFDGEQPGFDCLGVLAPGLGDDLHPALIACSLTEPSSLSSNFGVILFDPDMFSGCEEPGDESNVFKRAYLNTSIEDPSCLTEERLRTNDGGPCYFAVEVASYSYVDAFNTISIDSPIEFNLRQTEGLKPQPRRLIINNYAAIKVDFADQSAVNNWNGTITERTSYDSMDAQWAETGVGPFGGAVLAYTMSHPTSGNGRGWVLSIYSVGAVLMWRGYKGVGATPLGFYYQDGTTTPVGPACLECIDFSDDVWFPGETPPT